MKRSVHSGLLQMVAITLLAVVSCFNADAQMKYETNLNVGPSNFLGDLGGTAGRGETFLKDNNWSMTKVMKGVFFSVVPSEYVNFRASLNFGRLEGDDAIISPKGGLEEARKARNSDFRSSLIEFYAAAEVYPLVFLEEDPEDVWHKFRPYGLIGVGVFKFNPKGSYTPPGGGGEEWVELKPLRTEGQGMSNYPTRKEYSLTQFNVPYGVGLKYFFSEKVNLSFEIVNRITFTDYIDDVSTTYIADADFYNYFGAGSATADIAAQMANKSTLLTGGVNRPDYSAGSKRGTATNNDAYYSTTIKLGIRLGGDNYSNFTNQTRCPVLRF
jgi:Domain of unknown function (DUF6089)